MDENPLDRDTENLDSSVFSFVASAVRNAFIRAKRGREMAKKISVDEILSNEESERIEERLAGEISEEEEQVWGEDYVASGKPPSPPPPFPN
jgi:hypothetical protein